MKKHTKIYIDFFGWQSYYPCECCGNEAIDIHHVECRGMGGSDDKDYIENLMALCRPCHEKYGDKKRYKDFLKKTHEEFISKNIHR